MTKIKGAQKWKSLTHNGPAFPPSYKRLPQSVKLRYNGGPITNLSPMAEEAAVLFAAVKLSGHKDVNNRTFTRNFFEGFQDLLSPKQKTRVVQFRLLNFKDIVKHLKKQQGIEKSAKVLQAKKRRNEADKKKYGFCKVDRKIQPVGNYMVEPPSIFRGREGHPGHGRIKLRVHPKDVVINCSYGFRVKPPKNGKWKAVVHDQTATWLARYTNNLGQTKYIQLNQSSTLKAEGDREKYEIARALGKRIGTIRQKYQRGFQSTDEMKRQVAVALYIIDRFALRVGNEKGADEADTVGCCTLRKEHISLKGRNKIKFDFRGKDSIRFKKELAVPPKVYNLLKAFMKNKGKMLFDELNSSDLNKYLKELEPKLVLTAKVFRTYNASLLFQKLLMKTKASDNSSQAKLLKIYNQANLQVAKLCNHQKAVPKNAKEAIKKLEIRVKSSDHKLRLLRKKYKNLKSTEESDKLLGQLQKEQERNIDLKAKLELKIDGKEFALNTSKQNYIDPRITMAWCRKHGVELKKVFSKALLNKYKWALDEVERSRRNFRF